MAEQARDQARQAVGKAHEMGGQARDQAEGILGKLKKHSPGPVGWAAIIGLAGTLAVVSAIVLVILSPHPRPRGHRALPMHGWHRDSWRHRVGCPPGCPLALPLLQR